MAIFTYKARDHSGLAVDGVIEADDQMAVALNLSGLGYQVVHIEEKALSLKERIRESVLPSKVGLHEIIFFAQQLAIMIKAGVPLTAALSSLGQQVSNRKFSVIIQTILRRIEGGQTLSDSLAEHPKVFNDLFVSMVEVGETAGILGDVLDRIVLINNQELELKTRLRSALVYPAVLVVVAVGIVGFLIVKIIPKFIAVFESYDAQLPLATRSLMGISYGVTHFWYLFVIAIAGGIYTFKRYVSTEQGLYNYHRFLLKIPVFGDLYLKSIVSRFTRVLGMLVKSGVPIINALTVTEKTIDNVNISHVIGHIRAAITEGQSLTEPLKASGIFPPTVVQMVSAGEQSGKTDQMLIDIAAYYEKEVERTLKNATTLLEPLMLLVMGGIVAFIALSVLLPIFNLIKVFRSGG